MAPPLPSSGCKRVDILFVIDGSESMAEEQAALSGDGGMTPVFAEFTDAGAQVVGISSDSVASHKAFAELCPSRDRASIRLREHEVLATNLLGCVPCGGFSTTPSARHAAGIAGTGLSMSGTIDLSKLEADAARLVELAMRAGEAMEKIHSGALRVVHSVSDISLALKEQSAASAEIAVNVEKIAQMAEENNAAVAGTTSTARELERLAEGLQVEIRRYKVC